MREIIFSGKRVDNGEWVYGLPGYGSGGDINLICGWFGDDGAEIYESVEIVSKTVCQFIGRKDKWGKKIYEKDIMKVRLSTQAGGAHRKTKDFNLLVEWNDHDAGFHLVYPENYDSYRFMDGLWQSHEVVGNIFDNPEILSK